ncbi:MAG: NTP transferase domain-containing protein [Bacteroidales bacterium]|nr:NTP transferase domain-containing protein [Bacteroidales bacterium]
MKAMIFAAGLGTRLKPITDSMPKALVPVEGKALLERVMRKLMDAGADSFVVNVHHFPDQIKDFLAANDNFGAKVAVSDEQPDVLETGGGILNAKELIREAGDEEGFLVHNVDILSNLDVRSFVSQVRPEALATLLVSERQTQRYFLFNDEMRLVGWTNIATGEVRSPFPDLDVEKCHKYAFAGVHYISDKVFEVMEDLGYEGRFPIVDFYLKAAGTHPIYGVAPAGLKLMDVGKISTLESCRSFLAEIGER